MNIRNLSLTDAVLRSGLEKLQEREKPGEKPAYTITISREVGALGLRTAAEIGKRLGWPVYDRELLVKIGELMWCDMPHVERLRFDERHVGWFEEFLTSLSSSPGITPAAYVKKLVGVVQGLGKSGNCVIVGRGASFILPAATTIRVRLVAKLPDRIARIADIKALSEADAARHIETTDRSRGQFVKNTFGKDASDAHEYDLVINTSCVGTEEAAELIIDTLRLFGKRGKTDAVPKAKAAAMA